MNNKLWAALVLGGLLAAAPLFQEKPKKTGEPAVEKGRLPSLIRKDLLEKSDKAQASVERNIFRPDRRRTPAERAGGPSEGIDPLEGRPPRGQEEGGQSESAVSASSVPQLRYIGYIGTRDKAVALILLHGEAMAVSAGETPVEGIRIEKITPREIEFVGPDDTARLVSIEGEER